MVKVVGKIDLDSINQKTRPDKKKRSHFRRKTYRKQLLHQWQEKLNHQNMEKSTTFKGVPHTEVTAYNIPEEVVKENNIDINTSIIPVVDIRSLEDYGEEDSEIGGYYASRSELAQLFYTKHSSPQTILQGADPVILVPYKEEGDAIFYFDHFTLSWDKHTVYAVYNYNSTIS